MPLEVNGIDILPENMWDIRSLYGKSPSRGGTFVFTEPGSPRLDEMGSTSEILNLILKVNNHIHI